MARYRPVETKVDFPAMERAILAFWREADIFAKSLKLRAGSPEWVFYEGPPTANGRPGLHHTEARTFKDVFPRYKTMTGHYVHRTGGWDCHGLPVEVQVEREIHVNSKRDIEAFGVAEFVRLCRESVTRYIGEFEEMTERLGFWLDLDQAYFTMSPEYIQSVWWAVKRLHELGLLYQDDKVTAYCPRCGTGLSDHEVAQGYATVRDPSVYLRFPVQDGPAAARDASLVGWTTTPWTLISNLGLAVDPQAEYVRVGSDRGDLVVAAARLSALDEAVQAGGGSNGLTILERFPGSELVGVRYEAPFPNVADADVHRVVEAAFVSTDEGTGIVHMAPAFGSEDLEVGRREGWPVFNPVDDEGRFTDKAPAFVRGQFVKDADTAIIEDLRARGLLISAGPYEHTYPLCWRCDTPLLYYARPAWYIRTTARKAELLEANETVNWYPDHIKHGRYGDWLANNVDWSLSRERYWGTPLPVWRCPEGHHRLVGSLAELSALAGRDVTGIDPHRPAIDEVTVPCPECASEARRVPEVLDTWFDSGAMPFAQWGYAGPGSPGEERFLRRFPADFIAEALDQTRGWFYSLMAEGVLLFDSSAYRNVLCLGLLVDREGRKMSTRLGNVVDPLSVFDQQGADALRWFLLSSGSPWSDRRVSIEAFDDVVRRFLLTLWNMYAFFVTYANVDEPDLAAAPPPEERPPLDRWARSRLHGTVAAVRQSMEAFDATGAARRIEELVHDLSNWYVRRSRRRFWDPARAGAEEAALSKQAAFATLAECLTTLSRLLAPFTPFVAEELHRNLTVSQDPGAPESVHLADYPEPDASTVDPDLDLAMAVARAAASLGRQVRTQARIKVRQPVSRAAVHVPGDREAIAPLLPLVADELNARIVEFAESEEQLSGWRAKPNFRSLGPELGARVQEVAAALAADDGSLARKLASGQEITLSLPSGEVRLGQKDVELSQRTTSGWGVASDGTVTVALELELTEELKREGVVRDVIRAVQDLRKSAGLDVADRIALGIEGSPALTEAVTAHAGLLMAEVLATEVVTGAIDNPAAHAQVSIDGQTARLTLRRA